MTGVAVLGGTEATSVAPRPSLRADGRASSLPPAPSRWEWGTRATGRFPLLRSAGRPSLSAHFFTICAVTPI